MASNSLIEAVVYAKAAAKHATGRLSEVDFEENIPDWNDDGMVATEEMILITQNYKEMQQIMSYYVGIVRSNLRLERANNCHIDIQSGAMLHALGYITGNPTQSSVTIRSGATMYEAFQIRDWRGGSAVLEVAGSSTDDLIAKLYSGEDIVVSSSDKKVFPVGQYYLQTVETKLILEAGAVEMITTAASMSLSSLGEVELVANAPFVVPNNANYPTGFLRLGNNARFVKYYDRDKDRQVFQIEGVGTDAKAGFGILQMTFPLTVNVSVIEKQCKVIVSSEGYVLPIVNNLDVTLDNIELEVPYDINLLGDASITINKNATVKITKNFFVSDVEESKGMWYVGAVGNGTIFPIANTLWNSQYLLDNAGQQISSKDATHVKDANLFTTSSGKLYKRQVYDIAAYTNDIPMRDATVVNRLASLTCVASLEDIC